MEVMCAHPHTRDRAHEAGQGRARQGTAGQILIIVVVVVVVVVIVVVVVAIAAPESQLTSLPRRGSLSTPSAILPVLRQVVSDDSRPYSAETSVSPYPVLATHP